MLGILKSIWSVILNTGKPLTPKERSRISTAVTILVLLLTFAFVFFDIEIKENSIASSGILLVLYILIINQLTADDILYSGNPNKNRYSKAFQANLPTKYIMDKFGVDMNEAKSLWYGVFNKWAANDHQRHPEWERTTTRGFMCRFVYYTIISFRLAFFVSIILNLLIFTINLLNIKFNISTVDIYFNSHKNQSLPIIFSILCFLICFSFYYQNRSSKSGDLNGCFLKFWEINDLNIKWLEKHLSSTQEYIQYAK